MSKDKIVGIGMAVLIVSGAICAFQISQMPPGMSPLMATLTNPFGIISLIGLIAVFYGVIKKE